MARIARIVAVGYPHHITQRGNNKQTVFHDNNDRQKYLTLIRNHSTKYHVEILAYCLMDNHVHFIVIPHRVEALAETFNFAHMRYSQYNNKKMKMSGHLWQGRFYSCVMDEGHLYAAVRYIERNPVRAKVVRNAWTYTWSSARVHCGIDTEDPLGVGRLYRYIEGAAKDWRAFIDAPDKEQEVTEIKKNTMRGSVLASESFIRKLERRLGRRLFIKMKGRPKKKKK